MMYVKYPLDVTLSRGVSTPQITSVFATTKARFNLNIVANLRTFKFVRKIYKCGWCPLSICGKLCRQSSLVQGHPS